MIIRRVMSGINNFFLATLIKLITNIFNTSILFQSQLNDLEPEIHHEPSGSPPPTAAEMVMQWEKLMVTICVTSAIAIATVSLQIETKLSLMFHFLSITLMGCFVFTALAKVINVKQQRVSQILYCFGGFWLVTAFFIAIAIPYASKFQIVTLVIYLLFMVIIPICYFS